MTFDLSISYIIPKKEVDLFIAFYTQSKAYWQKEAEKLNLHTLVAMTHGAVLYGKEDITWDVIQKFIIELEILDKHLNDLNEHSKWYAQKHLPPVSSALKEALENRENIDIITFG